MIKLSLIHTNFTRWENPKGENRDSSPLMQAKALLLRSIKLNKAVPALLAGTAVRLCYMLALIAGLSACGQYGSLYLPKERQETKPMPTTDIKPTSTRIMTPAA